MWFRFVQLDQHVICVVSSQLGTNGCREVVWLVVDWRLPDLFSAWEQLRDVSILRNMAGRNTQGLDSRCPPRGVVDNNRRHRRSAQFQPG